MCLSRPYRRALAVALLVLVTLPGMFVASPLQADNLTIEITQGVDNPTKIAVVPFSWDGDGLLSEDVSSIIEADLKRSGLFSFPSGVLSTPHQQSEVDYKDWRAIGVEYLLIGKVMAVGGVQPYQVQYELFDIYRQDRLYFGKVKGAQSQLRDLAHFISDKVYLKLTGARGAFSTKVLYVATKKRGSQRSYQLLMADADGARQLTILKSHEPILSPSWSPDGKQIAYVSFENGRPAIYRQRLSDGQREQLTRFKGLNGAPSWSPDGKKMAMVLSKDGNPEIYVMDLSSKALTRVTNNYSIDTEPSWLPDGKSLVFTSNRGGKPQIYQATLATGWVKRLTFEGDYNARPTPSGDGKSIVMVHRNKGVFHIAVQDLLSGSLDVLTKTHLDESPSVAPNSSMVMYATQREGKGVLAVVSIDGLVKLFLPAKFHDVREPAWSPFL
jgi:TolB protein